MLYRIVAGLLAIGTGWMIVVSHQEGTLPVKKAILFILVGVIFLILSIGFPKLLKRIFPGFRKKL